MEDAHQSNLAYWNRLSPLERYTIAYAAYHGMEQSLDLLISILQDIEPPIFASFRLHNSVSSSVSKALQQHVFIYELAKKAIYRNRKSPFAAMRKWLRSIDGYGLRMP